MGWESERGGVIRQRQGEIKRIAEAQRQRWHERGVEIGGGGGRHRKRQRQKNIEKERQRWRDGITIKWHKPECEMFPNSSNPANTKPVSVPVVNESQLSSNNAIQSFSITPSKSIIPKPKQVSAKYKVGSLFSCFNIQHKTASGAPCLDWHCCMLIVRQLIRVTQGKKTSLCMQRAMLCALDWPY